MDFNAGFVVKEEPPDFDEQEAEQDLMFGGLAISSYEGNASELWTSSLDVNEASVKVECDEDLRDDETVRGTPECRAEERVAAASHEWVADGLSPISSPLPPTWAASGDGPYYSPVSSPVPTAWEAPRGTAVSRTGPCAPSPPPPVRIKVEREERCHEPLVPHIKEEPVSSPEPASWSPPRKVEGGLPSRGDKRRVVSPQDPPGPPSAVRIKVEEDVVEVKRVRLAPDDASPSPEVRVKEEDLSDEEEYSRSLLFGSRFAVDEDDVDLDLAYEGVQAAQDEEEMQPAQHDEDTDQPRCSTTLHPQRPPTITSREELINNIQSIIKKAKQEKVTEKIVKKIKERRHSSAHEPFVIDAAPIPKRSGHRQATSCDRARATKEEQVKVEASPPSPRSKPEPCSPPQPPPRRISDSSSSDDGRGKIRVAHKPPSWYRADDASAASASGGPEDRRPSRDPRLNKPGPRCSKLVPCRDSPVVRPGPKCSKPGFLRTPGAAEGSHHDPNRDPNRDRNRDRHRFSSGSDMDIADSDSMSPASTPEKPAGGPAYPEKRGLLPAPSKKSGLLPTPPRKSGLLPTPPRKSGLLPTPPKKSGLLPTPARKSEEIADPDPACSFVKAASPVPGWLSSDSESDWEPPSKRRVPKKKQLPFLPAASHIKLSPEYEGRSPLFVEDDEPRKSYTAARPGSDLPDSKIPAASSPSWLVDVLFDICRWKPEWLKESRSISRDKCPEIVPKSVLDRHKNVKDTALTFPSIQSYKEHFRVGLLFELWETVRKDAHLSSAYVQYAQVDGPPMDKSMLGNRIRRTYSCHCGSKGKKPFVPGDLVIVSEIGDLSKQFFAYVEVVGKSKFISDTESLSETLQDLQGSSTILFKSNFKLTVCQENFTDDSPVIFAIKKVRNIYEEVETFKYLSEIQDHVLAPLLLEPRYSPRNEPHFVLKTVSYDQRCQLGSEQKQVALSIIQDILHYEAPSISIVDGGPGTGKTHLAAALAQELVEGKKKDSRDCYVLIMTKTNEQLNNISTKLHERSVKLSSNEKDPDSFRAVFLGTDSSVLDCFKQLQNGSLTKLAKRHMRLQKTHAHIEERVLLEKKIKKKERELKHCNERNIKVPELASECAKLKRDLIILSEKIEQNIVQTEEKVVMTTFLEKSDILFSTLGCCQFRKMAQAALQKKPRKHVVLIIDDASEITEPAILRPLVVFGVTDVVLFGDFNQHNPYVSSKFARNAGLVISLMERYSSALKAANCSPPHRQLTKQYRLLHQDIFRCINDSFYEGKMKLTRHCAKFELKPCVWFNCTFIPEGTEKYAMEAAFVVKLVKEICEVVPNKKMKVTSFNKQISDRLKRSEIKQFVFHDSNSECEVMVISLGPHSTTRFQKMLVSLTRARQSLFVCGNFSQDVPRDLLPLLRYAKGKGMIIDIKSEEASVVKLIKA